MASICRTCTQSIKNNEYFYLNGSSYTSNTLQLIDMLKSCIPEFNVDVVAKAVICRNCMSALHIAYSFRTNTVNNQEFFQDNRHDNEEDKLKIEIMYNHLDEVIAQEDLDEVNAVEIQMEPVTDVILRCTEESAINHTKFVECLPQHDCIDCNDCCNSSIKLDKRLQDEENFPLITSSEVCIKNMISDKVNCNNLSPQNDYGTDNSKVIVKQKEIKYQDDKSSVEIRSLNENIITHERPYKCNECSFQTKMEGNLKIHCMIHKGDKPFQCSICPYKANRKSHVQDHMTKHTKKYRFKCSKCTRCFLNSYLLRKHLQIHTGDKPFSCAQCNYKSRLKRSLIAHIQKIHMEVPQVTPKYICSICGKQLGSHSALSSHMRIHAGVKPYLCELCGRYFREEGILRNHLRIHTGEKPFKCTKCDFAANRKGNLQGHMKTHDGNNILFECKECSKHFSIKMLMKHIRNEHKSDT